MFQPPQARFVSITQLPVLAVLLQDGLRIKATAQLKGAHETNPETKDI